MSARVYYLMCPTGPTNVQAPSVRDQIDRALRYAPAWRPPQECTFTLRPLAEGEERPTLDGAWRNVWRDPWRDQYIESTDRNARLLAEQYRCAEHGLAPRVFRQHHAYLVHRDRRTGARFLHIITSQRHPDPRAPWPEEFTDHHSGVWVYIPIRPPAASTHRLWPST